jgi:hypothetical protein
MVLLIMSSKVDADELSANDCGCVNSKTHSHGGCASSRSREQDVV